MSHHSFSASCGDRAGITSKAWFFAHLFSVTASSDYETSSTVVSQVQGSHSSREGLWLFGQAVPSRDLSPPDLFCLDTERLYSLSSSRKQIFHYEDSRSGLKIKPFQESTFIEPLGKTLTHSKEGGFPLHGLLALS